MGFLLNFEFSFWFWYWQQNPIFPEQYKLIAENKALNVQFQYFMTFIESFDTANFKNQFSYNTDTFWINENDKWSYIHHYV